MGPAGHRSFKKGIGERFNIPRTFLVNPKNIIKKHGYFLSQKNAIENKEVYEMSDKPASNGGILRKSDEKTVPGNSI